MRVSELYGPDGPVRDRRVCIVGTGPSMDVFPVTLLEQETCILLNDAPRLYPRLGPIAFASKIHLLDGVTLPYQIVRRRFDSHCPWDDPRRYVFRSRLVALKDWRRKRANVWKRPDTYWTVPGGCIAVAAIQFALLAGASSIALVGCDCGGLGRRHHAGPLGKTRTRRTFKARYDRYRYGLRHIIRLARGRFACPIVSWTPFVGVGDCDEQYEEMRRWR